MAERTKDFLGVISISKKSVEVLCQFPRKVGLSNRMLRAAAVRVTVYNWADLDTLSQHQLLSEEEIFTYMLGIRFPTIR